VDETGPLLGGDVIAGEERARTREEPAEGVHRVAGDGPGEVGAFTTPNDIKIREWCQLHSDALSELRLKHIRYDVPTVMR